MKKLVVIGDSWGCGEWQYAGSNQLEASHPGLNQYLADCFEVTNLSRSGASNWQTCYTLHNFLEFNLPLMDSVPDILLIQTDAARFNLADRFDVDCERELGAAENLRDLYTKLVEMFYIKCDAMAREYGVRLNFSGGLSDLDVDIMSLYPGLIPLCPSWIQLLCAQHIPDVIPLRVTISKTSDSDLFQTAKKQGRADICDEIMEHSNRNLLPLQDLLESDFFGPSLGDFHPSRQGHQILSNHIKSCLGDSDA
jgi:hypothetical protein